MIVEQLWRYPVKSIGGEQVDSSFVTELGLQGDRHWGICDNATGMFLTARREPRLLEATAQLDGSDGVSIRLSSGEELVDDDALSRWLESDVSLVKGVVDTPTYESPEDAETEADWYSWTGPAGSLHDEEFARVSLLSVDSLGSWDVRRFRPNIVFRASNSGQLGQQQLGERHLIGKTVRIGALELAVQATIPRCVMVTRPQPGIDRDLSVLKTINANHGGEFSVGALVSTVGEISVGQAMSIV